VFARRLINKQVSEADKSAVNEECSFIMNLKRNTSIELTGEILPHIRVKTVLDKASRATVAYVASTPARKQSKQQRRSSAGIGRELADTLPGLAVECNVEAEYSWVWNDNQVGAAANDPKLLTRLLAAAKSLSSRQGSLIILPKGRRMCLLRCWLQPTRSFLTETALPLSRSPARVTRARERANPTCQAAIKRLSGLLLKRKRPTMIF
jgi:hypothetical protein